jgi:hypothetical protein
MQIVRLQIVDMNVAQYYNVNPDNLLIYDGNSSDAPLIRRLNFSFYSDDVSRMPSYQSTQRFMFVKFVSDGSFSYSGFRMTYSSIPQGMLKVQIKNKMREP